MKTEKIILFDEVCPLCRVYTGAFVACRWLGPEGRIPFPEGLGRWGNRIDLDRARREIPLVDTAGGPTLYGIDALLWIIGERFPRLVKLARFPWAHRMLTAAYHFISANRRVIVGATGATRPEDGAPPLDKKQRLAWLGLTALLVTATLAAGREFWATAAHPFGYLWLAATAAAGAAVVRGWDGFGRLAGHAVIGTVLWTAVYALPFPIAQWLAAAPVLTVLFIDARRRCPRGFDFHQALEFLLQKTTPLRTRIGRRVVPTLEQTLRLLIAGVWLVNGLWCKFLGFVPRHEAIAARVLGLENARFLIQLIGLAEIAMAAWILSGVYRRLSAAAQITLVALMNALECWRAPDLLLFGRWNAVFALGFLILLARHARLQTPAATVQ